MTLRDLQALLDQMLEGQLTEADVAPLLEPHYREMAVLMVDMADFTRLTRDKGIPAALLSVRRLQRATLAAVADTGGWVVKADADNLLCTFDQVAEAKTAALSILGQCNCSIGLGYGPILVLDDDIFGDAVNDASRLGEDVAGHGELLLTDAAASRLAAPTTPSNK